MEPQNNLLCVLFHQEVQPDRQILCLPEEKRELFEHLLYRVQKHSARKS